MSNNYDIKTLKAVKQLFDSTNIVRAAITLTQWIAESESEAEKRYHKTDTTKEDKAAPMPDAFDYWKENDMN
jgi:hypothetical protein